MIRVSCRANITFRLLLDCGEEDEAIGIVKAHMLQTAREAAASLKGRDEGYQVDLDVDYMVAYEEPAGV